MIGYRAPTFSIGSRSAPWAHAVLAEEGHRYSSSVFPVKHDLYGEPDAPRAPYRPDPSGVIELPMTTVRVGRRNLPCAGGGWFRLVPYALFRAGLKRVNGEARVRLHRGSCEVAGVRSPDSLMEAAGATYGEGAKAWTGAEAAGFSRLHGFQGVLAERLRARCAPDGGKSQ